MSTDTAQRQARRLANAGQPTPAHILSALNLLADYCEQHGYGAVVLGPDYAPAFLIEHPMAEHARLVDALAAEVDRLTAENKKLQRKIDYLDGPRIPRLEPDDYPAIARLSE